MQAIFRDAGYTLATQIGVAITLVTEIEMQHYKR